MVRRSKVDWALEAVALAALAATLAMVAVYWPQMPGNTLTRFGQRPAITGFLSAKNTLWVVAMIDAAAYVGLTLGARGGGLFQIPKDLDREAPHLRQMLFSVAIVMKAVLMLFGAYLVWSLVNVALRRGGGLDGGFLTLFTLAVPVPLIFYTVKMRRYRR